MIMRMFFGWIIALCSITAFADMQNTLVASETQIIPLLQYDNLNLDAQSVESTSVGLVMNSEDTSFVGLYTQHHFSEPLRFEYPRRYHTVDMLLDGKHKGNQYLAILKSESDQPVEGGLNTFQAAAAYGYEVIRKPNYSLVVGGGLAIGDFGIETPDGHTWPIIPAPLVRMNYASNFVEAKFEFLTSPNLSFTLYPKNRARFLGDIRMDQLRDLRDIIFEFKLDYRLFTEKSLYGDFAGISVGIKNDNYGEFNLGGHKGEETFEVHYYSLFTTLDLSLLKITAGYAFGGRELYRETIKQDVGKGAFFSLQGMIPF